MPEWEGWRDTFGVIPAIADIEPFLVLDLGLPRGVLHPRIHRWIGLDPVQESLADLREGDRRLAGRILHPEQKVRDDVAILLAREPNFEYGWACCTEERGIHRDARVVLEHQGRLRSHRLRRRRCCS